MADPIHPIISTTSRTLLGAILGLVLAVFTVDFFTPLGIIVWVFYLAPVVLTIYGRSTSLPIAVAVAAALLICLSTFTDAPGINRSIALTNRLLGVLTIGVLAVVVRQVVFTRVGNEREAWIRSGHRAVLEAVQGEHTPAVIGERLLEVLGGAAGGVVGAFYVVEGKEARLLASVALDRARSPERQRAGESLIGQALTDRRVVTISDLPDDTFRMEAGIGSARPRHLAVVPLWADNAPVGVVALGTMAPFSPEATTLLDRIGEPAAVAARTAQFRQQLQELLAETQRQAEELQAQQEELRVVNEELEEQSRSLRVSQAQLEEQQQELEQSNAHLETQSAELERQRDEVEAARRAADQANSTKSEFLANMSHELRTPLNSALILARLLADNKPGNLSADQVRHAETIYSAGNDLLILINDILDLSKIEAGRIEVQHEDVAPRRVAAELEPVFQPVARQRGVGFQIEIGPAVPPAITTDAHRLQQILKNLLSNAFKFTEKGAVTLSISADARTVSFAVRDTGVGIPAEQQEAIWGAFQQADTTTSRRFGGTGLGLTISRQLARLLGAEIELDSAPGRGSTFTVIVPRVAGAPALRALPAASPPPSRAPTPIRGAAAYLPDDRDDRHRPARLVLVIEDDPAFSRILYDLAHELDFDCVLAASAGEGMTLARDLLPSGILLDVGLPDGSGLSVLERLKRDPRTRHIPIHMVSVNDHTRTAMELGAVGYALKPVAREELIKAIGKLEGKLSQKLRRVLVVEDDPRQRESTMELLRGEDVEITPAGTVAGALAELGRQSFDCVVLDLKLPDGTGYDLLEQMAGAGDQPFPPVIVYTGRELTRDEEERLRRSSRSIIIKGARSPERLLDEVTLFLHQVESSLPAERQRMLRDVREREAAFEGRRILVVEDDVRNIFALTSLLEPRGARIEIARNGKEALARLDGGPAPDIVLMDIMMPEMDGLTAMREIRKRPALKDLPIIALTAKAMRDDQEQCLAAGANDYMAKPLDIDKLLSLCRVWMPRAA